MGEGIATARNQGTTANPRTMWQSYAEFAIIPHVRDYNLIISMAYMPWRISI
jgi:hypothetical protein